MRIRSLTVLLITLVVLALPHAAAAATPADDVYDPVDIKVQGSDGNTDAIPFTGLDVAVVVFAGAVLLGTGVAIRRSARSD